MPSALVHYFSPHPHLHDASVLSRSLQAHRYALLLAHQKGKEETEPI